MLAFFGAWENDKRPVTELAVAKDGGMSEASNEGAGKWVLVTGASAGIGAAFAEEFALHGFNLILTARRGDRMTGLASAMEDKYRTRSVIIPGDLADPDTPRRLFERIAAEGAQVDALVNNAGFSVAGDFVSSAWDRQEKCIQVMITAVAALCRLALPGMIERGYGRIINVGSLAGLSPASAGQTLYGGAKAFVLNLSETLRSEVDGTGVTVCALCPGYTYSEFHDVAGTRGFVSKSPGFMWMSAEKVAQIGYAAAMEGKSMCVPGQYNKLFAFLLDTLPRSVVLRLVANRAKRLRSHVARQAAI